MDKDKKSHEKPLSESDNRKITEKVQKHRADAEGPDEPVNKYDTQAASKPDDGLDMEDSERVQEALDTLLEIREKHLTAKNKVMPLVVSGVEHTDPASPEDRIAHLRGKAVVESSHLRNSIESLTFLVKELGGTATIVRPSTPVNLTDLPTEQQKAILERKSDTPPPPPPDAPPAVRDVNPDYPKAQS